MKTTTMVVADASVLKNYNKGLLLNSRRCNTKKIFTALKLFAVWTLLSQKQKVWGGGVAAETGSNGMMEENDDYYYYQLHPDNIKHVATQEQTLYRYHAHPLGFVDEFEDCVRDPSCQVFYHHVQKASGSYIGTILYPWMNTMFAHPMRDEIMKEKEETGEVTYRYKGRWCCYSKVMGWLMEHPEERCQYKFSTWEVSPEQFNEVLDTCVFNPTWRYNNLSNRQSDEDDDRGHSERDYYDYGEYYQEPYFQRAIVLVNYREPVSRTLSLIHHLCNVGDKPLHDQIRGGAWEDVVEDAPCASEDEFVDACHRCSYYAKPGDAYQISPPTEEFILKNLEDYDRKFKMDSDIWDHFVKDTMKKMRGVEEVVGHVHDKDRSKKIEEMNSPHSFYRGTTTLLLDTEDTSSFLTDLEKRFSQDSDLDSFPDGYHNRPFKKRTCEFNVSAIPEMMEQLQAGSEIYNDLKSGKEEFCHLYNDCF